MTEFTVPLPADLPTPNRRRVMHWSWQARVTKEMRDTTAIIGRSARKGAPADDRRTVAFVLVRGKGQRFVDVDAVGTALKGCLDGLKDAGLIVDDSPRWLSLTTDQERGPSPALRVTVE